MKTRGDAESPKEVEYACDYPGCLAHAGVNGAQASQVKGNHPYDYYPSLVLRLSRRSCCQLNLPGSLLPAPESGARENYEL